MIRRISSKLTPSYDRKHAQAPRVTTFTYSFDSPMEVLEAARRAHLFFDTYGQCDRKIHGCPLLLINSGHGDGNTILMRDPHSEAWVDVTRASEEDLETIAMGYEVQDFHRSMGQRHEPITAIDVALTLFDTLTHR